MYKSIITLNSNQKTDIFLNYLHDVNKQKRKFAMQLWNCILCCKASAITKEMKCLILKGTHADHLRVTIATSVAEETTES